MAEWFIYAGVAYCLLDFVLGIVFLRCVLPGLRCRACREGGDHGG